MNILSISVHFKNDGTRGLLNLSCYRGFLREWTLWVHRSLIGSQCNYLSVKYVVYTVHINVEYFGFTFHYYFFVCNDVHYVYMWTMIWLDALHSSKDDVRRRSIAPSISVSYMRLQNLGVGVKLVRVRV